MADQRKVELILGIRTEGAADASLGLESISKVAAELSGELSSLERADVLKELGATAAQVGVNIGDLDAAAAVLASDLKNVGASEAEIRKVSAAFDSTVASIEKAEKAQAALNDRMAKDAEKAQAAQEKLGAAMARDVEKLRAAQEKQGALQAAEIEKSAAAAEKLGEKEAFAAAKAREAATGASSLQRELGKISRDDQIQKLSTDMGALAKKTGDVSGSVAELDKKLKALGATEQEVQSGAGAFNSALNSSEGGGGNLLQRGGTALRGLPSIQLGGGISSDAIGNITRLTGALGEASGATGLMASATTALTPILGATAAGVAGVIAVAGPLVVIVGALGLAIKAFSDQAAEESKQINSIIDAQREVSQEIAEGLTTDEAKKKIDEINAAIKTETDLRNKNQQVYHDNIENQGALTAVLKATSGAEQALTDQITKSNDIIAANETKVNALTLAMENGTLAANDAAEAEKKLAEERTKAVLSEADAAGKELAAQQKALASTEEQNQKRLASIEDEKAVIQRQIDVLTASGDTSEEVTAKLAALNGQLGSLGKESQFIKDVALEVSRQADAEKKAKKDAEDAAKKAEQAQETYTKSVKSATLAYKNSVQDIGTRLRQTLSDNTLKLNRDLTDIATKYKRDEYDLTIKANRAERDALQDQVDDIAKLRRDANKEEAQAIQEGDFKALFLARQKNVETLQDEQRNIDVSANKRRQADQDAREDLLRNAQRQRIDRLQGYERQNIDARTAQQRDLQQAALTRQRALALASEGLNAELKQLGSYYQARLQMETQYQQASMQILQGGGAAKGPNQSKSKYAAGFESSFTAVVRR